MQRDQLESHIERATKGHLDKVRETQEKIKEKIMHLERLKEKVDINLRLNEELADKLKDIQEQHPCRADTLQEQLEEVKTSQEQHQYRVDTLQEQLEEVKTSQQQKQRRVGILQERLEKNLKTCQTKLEQKISMERTIVTVSVCLVLGLVFLTFHLTRLEDRFQKKLDSKFNALNTDVRNKLLILEVNIEESRGFTWKIPSFENKLRQAKNNENRLIESDPFYAYGYKLMLQLYPNGNGVGEHTHLSIFIAVLKGEYDAILPWGFSRRVTLTLIDQQDNPNQRRNVANEFTADPNAQFFKKPVEGDTSLWVGFPQFVSHSFLRTRRFVVDDTLFIKVQIDEPKSKSTLWY